jgi:folate-binding Fe-S cluster repair protein YgfZ
VQQSPAGEEDRPRDHRRDEGRDDRAEQVECCKAADEIEAHIHAEHEELALGEIHDPHDAEDQPEPDAHRAIEAADDQAGRERIEDVLDQDVLPLDADGAGVRRQMSMMSFTGKENMGISPCDRFGSEPA